MVAITPTFSNQDYKILAEKKLHQGFYELVQYQFTHKKFNGQSSATITREMLKTKASAAILPYDPVRETVILLEQFRMGAVSHMKTPWIFETVAGLLADNESPLEAIKREAVEEAGVPILDIELLYEYLASPGNSNEYLHLYCGRVETNHVESLHGLPEENEDIRAIVLPVNDAFRMLDQGQIQSGYTIIALLWLKLNRERLKTKWQTK